MSSGAPQEQVAVEVRPEVVFLYELLQDLTRGRIRIPRFQRPFVWRRDQMTDLLDSVNRQYPIGSLLIWETGYEIATLDRLGPFSFPKADGPVGYLLDGHQRLSTLAGALLAPDEQPHMPDDPDPGRWRLAYNFVAGRFQHADREKSSDQLFPLTSLLDTLRFFREADALRLAYSDNPVLGEEYLGAVSTVARSFQHYRVPVIRIRETGPSEAVEIFARLNSKGQAMTADQMVSALMYRDPSSTRSFDLARKIDAITATIMEELAFGDVDRTIVLRAVLANMDEDIYRTDWTRLTSLRRDEMMPRMEAAATSAGETLVQAVAFLRREVGIPTSRLLPYSMQLVLLSAFFNVRPAASERELVFLRQWFWVSSFSGWFGSANPSRINALITEFRRHLPIAGEVGLASGFDLGAPALPYPTSFDTRSARTRSLLLVMLALRPRDESGRFIPEPWRLIAESGPAAIGHIITDPSRAIAGSPANRMLRPAGIEGGLRNWILRLLERGQVDVLASHAISVQAAEALAAGDLDAFIRLRSDVLIAAEGEFQRRVGVRSASVREAASPVDTE